MLLPRLPNSRPAPLPGSPPSPAGKAAPVRAKKTGRTKLARDLRVLLRGPRDLLTKTKRSGVR